MACAAAAVAVISGRDSGDGNTDKGFRRSDSGNELLQCRRRPTGMVMRRSASDPVLLRCSHESPPPRKPVGQAHAAGATKPRNSRSVGIFPSNGTARSMPATFDPDAAKSMKLLDPECGFDQGNHRVLGEDDLSVDHVNYTALQGTAIITDDGDGMQHVGTDAAVEEGHQQQRRVHWLQRILELRRQWRDHRQKDVDIHGECDVSYDDDNDDNDEDAADETQDFDVGSFHNLLSQVPLHTAQLFSRLAFLCNRAYTIPDIKEEELRAHRLQWVTSSILRKSDPAAAAIRAKLDADSTRLPPLPPPPHHTNTGEQGQEELQQEPPLPPPRRPTKPSIAFRIAATAASYVHTRAKGLLSLGAQDSQEDQDESGGGGVHVVTVEQSQHSAYKPRAAACMAASTMTTVVAVEEKAKQEAARDLRSPHKSPCEWYVCDEHTSCTRYFVIQGSDSVTSWQANLFFEPINFEETEALVHRGIYEAANGMYQQFMPLVVDHLHKYGDRARFQFTGHSLGGSLSMLINLMLLGRGVLERHMLLPVVTFGSPFVFCGGRGVLEELGLDEGHVLTVMMHRDIVPRAFACTYPNQVSQILKKLCGTFKSHPCLNNEKLLYSPLGRVFILQPEESSSPSHPFLPSGSGLHALDSKKASRAEVMMGLRAFLNSPHPLETLSDPTAYGSEGTILRDHDSGNYLKAVNTVVERERRQLAVMKESKKMSLMHQYNMSHLRLLPDKSCCDNHRRSHQGRDLDVELVCTELVVGI